MRAHTQTHMHIPGLRRDLQHDGVHDEGDELGHHVVYVQFVELGRAEQSNQQIINAINALLPKILRQG